MNRDDRPKCWIIEDEADEILIDGLKGFENIKRPEVIQYVFVGDDYQREHAKSKMGKYVNVVFPEIVRRSLEDDGTGLDDWLYRRIVKHDLLIVDIKLNKYFRKIADNYGIDLLYRVLKRTSKGVRKTIDVCIITQFPDIFVANLKYYDDIVDLLGNRRPVVIQKVADFPVKLQYKIDEWRIKKGIVGKDKGPTLCRLIDRWEKDVYYVFQPIVNIWSGQIYCHETLLREQRSRCFPFTAWQDAYSLGRNHKAEVDMLAIKGFIKWLKDNRDMFGELEYSVNVSGDTICSTVFSEYFIKNQPMESAGSFNSRLKFEITEHGEREGLIDEILLIARDLKKYGYRVGIDDFGTKSSNIDRVNRICPDFIKADRTIVKKILEDKSGSTKAIIDGVFKYAQQNNAELIAEGFEVEYGEREIKILADVGFQYIQGFLFGFPEREPILRISDASRVLLNNVNRRKK
ncbi:EAL domain-containing protein [bacterium]|nr:EAL domain-containing protein [bacterium]